MAVQTGDHVLVNVAPFVGSVRRSKESIPCRVLAIDGPHVQVETDFPCRALSLWVLSNWIERKLDDAHEPPSPTFCADRPEPRRSMMAG
jgi:hypothetical protein